MRFRDSLCLFRSDCQHSNNGTMRKLIISCIVVLLQPVFSFHAFAEPISLSEAYQRAQTYDAKYLAAEADHAAQREEVGKARSNFRPNIKVGASIGRNATETTRKNEDPYDTFYNTRNYSIILRQPLLNLSNIAAYKQAKAVSKKSGALLDKESAGLMLRTLEAYVNVMYALDNLEFSKMYIAALKEQMQQAKRRFDTGFGTVTEISEAQANYDRALADGVESNNTLETNRRELESIAGVYAVDVLKLNPKKILLIVPEPQNAEKWIDMALENSTDIDAAQAEVTIARKQIDKNRAARYPTFDFVASKSFSESENNYSIGSEYDTYGVSLQMNLPIYTGGYTSASVRQASAQYTEASEQKNMKTRQVTVNVRKYFNGLLSSIAQIRAYEQAVKSSETALIGTKKGFSAGFRSNVDVLNAEAKLFENNRNLAKSRYQYILNLAKLKEMAGMLTDRDIDMIDSWMR